MNIFDLLITQPIFNLLAIIYALIPGQDFGVALIIFTVLVRLAMWPLIKKQLHQVKVQREIQPELKKIKQKAAGNKQLEGQLMLELYREKGVNPMGSIFVLLLQLPIFLALYNVIKILTQHGDQVSKWAYGFVQNLAPIQEIINSSTHTFNESFLGVVNLSRSAIENGQIYWPLMILAVLTAVLQYYQSKQISPQPTEHKRLRDVMAATAAGKEVDQSEVSAIMSQRMLFIFPIMTLFIMIYLPGALALYYAAGSAVAIIQQKIILSKDVKEMEVLADVAKTSDREKNAQEAVVVAAPKQRGKKRSKRRN